MRWSQVSGPGTVSFSSPNYAISAARFSGSGFYRLRLSATDGELTASDDVFIMVRTNSDLTPPVISGLQAGEVTDDSITVSWSTDENATEQLEYGPNGGFERSTLLHADLRQARAREYALDMALDRYDALIARVMAHARSPV